MIVLLGAEVSRVPFKAMLGDTNANRYISKMYRMVMWSNCYISNLHRINFKITSNTVLFNERLHVSLAVSDAMHVGISPEDNICLMVSHSFPFLTKQSLPSVPYTISSDNNRSIKHISD